MTGQRVFSWVASSRVVKSHLGSSDVVCHCGGTGDRGLFAPQSSCPGSSRRQGSHLPCTSVGLLHSTQPASESGRYLQNSQCAAGRGEQTPTPVNLAAYVDTLGHADAPAACIVLKSSGRGGHSVKEETSRRHREREFQSSRCSQPAISKPLFNHHLFTRHVHENGRHVCSRACRDSKAKMFQDLNLSM